CQHYYSIPSSF
nr:immunoglobulin light chain junction region [Macaca mulatta]MPN91275.1 immunoglobulin light chain junction region [Macaca mulatta]MPN91345.1 immunoglobulin light chain junction region [Macaca mulatta]MPN91675.1 immunoglobulin light chain junction region [Macaca mulatta]MPN91848.1 immunoglobulin light chain junction region [Macaca mulatta]